MADALNRNSFVRLYSGSSLVSLPIIPLREKQYVSPPIIGVPGETMSFYIAQSASGGASMVDGSGNSFGLGSISGVTTTIGNHGILNITVPSAPDGVYKMTVGGMESNYIDIVNDVALANQISAVVLWSHKKILDNFYYPYCPADYQQKARLRMSLTEIQPETNIEGYEATNTGKQRNLQGVFKKYATFMTPDYSLEDHDAMAVLALHDNISINGKVYIRRPQGTYKMSPDMALPACNGEFSLYDNSSTFLLRC